MRLFPRLAAAALLAITAAPLLAQSLTAGTLVIDQPWSRQTAPTQKVGGGFLTITNKGKADDRLISATSPVASEVQMHMMSMTGGVMRMREIKNGIAVPAGQSVALKPGGHHLMFMGLKRPLRLGESFPVTLRFERQGMVTVRFKVAPVGAAGPSEMHHDD